MATMGTQTVPRLKVSGCEANNLEILPGYLHREFLNANDFLSPVLPNVVWKMDVDWNWGKEKRVVKHAPLLQQRLRLHERFTSCPWCSICLQ